MYIYNTVDRVWGCPTTAMWVYRVGPEQAKRMLLTGDVIDGREAERIGLVMKSVPCVELDGYVDSLGRRISSVPKNQLFMQKTVVNQAIENMGLASTQTLATLFDGITRHSPEGEDVVRCTFRWPVCLSVCLSMSV